MGNILHELGGINILDLFATVWFMHIHAIFTDIQSVSIDTMCFKKIQTPDSISLTRNHEVLKYCINKNQLVNNNSAQAPFATRTVYRAWAALEGFFRGLKHFPTGRGRAHLQPQKNNCTIGATDKITCLGKMPSPNVGGLLSVLHVLNLWGIGFGGPLSVMKVPWAASKFKTTSYYPVHSLILSATHIQVFKHIVHSQVQHGTTNVVNTRKQICTYIYTELNKEDIHSIFGEQLYYNLISWQSTFQISSINSDYHPKNRETTFDTSCL